MVGITRIVLQGFRGANKPLDIPISESIVISGPTGSGKTTILQAIEWGLYGKILGFTGPGFTDEDAYINIFTDEKQASVTLNLILKDGTHISVQRKRKEAAKSTVGKTNVMLTVNGSSNTGKEAQEQIEELIGLDHEKFVQALFLHQETIRRFVDGKPQDRSAIIDQLLGTAQIREFAEALNPKRKIRKEIKVLQITKDRLEGEQTMIEVDSQEQLDEQRDTILAQGYKETDLTPESLEEKIHQLFIEITKLAKTYNTTPPSTPEKIKTTEDIITAMENVDSKLHELDRSRGECITKYTEDIVRIQELVKQYDEAVKELSKEQKPQEDFEKEIKKLQDKQSKLEEQQNQLREQANNLEPYVSEHQRLSQLIEQQKKELENFENKNGNFKTLQEKKKANSQKIEKLTEELKQAGTLAQILMSAHSYISVKVPTLCPVCEQNIEPKVLLSHLEEENKKHGNQLQQKQTSVNTLKEKNNKLDSLFSELGKLNTELESQQKTVNEKLKQIHKILGQNDITAKDGGNLIEENRKSAEALEVKIKKLKDEIWRLEQKKDGILRLDDTLLQLEGNLQEEISVKLIKQKLIKATELYLQEPKLKIKQLEDTEPIDALRKQLKSLKIVFDYVRNVESFENRREEKSLLEQHMEFIDQQIKDLEELEASLFTLCNILSEHQGTLTTQALREFQSSIENYYNQILGHPYFQKIRIEPLSTEPITYDIIAYNEEESVKTHINTRYSTAQINASALAIFFAVNQKLAENFPLIILDDPTQNMDQSHQEALAQTLAILSNKRQIIIASHNEQFVQHFLGCVKTKFNHLIMGQWTTDGPKPTE